jgi:membrane protease YdiL (CAAX protease family)
MNVMGITFDTATSIFLVWTCVGMPWLAYLSYRKIKSGVPLPPKIKRFRTMVVLLLVTGWLADNTALSNGVELEFTPTFLGLFFGISVTVGTVIGVVRGRHRQPSAHRERIRKLYAPTNTPEYLWAITGGTCAGICEEIAYRGVLLALLARLTGSLGVGIVLCVVFFVLAHLPQGLRGAIGVASLATIFHIIYAVTGSLLAPILIHALYDIGIFTILFVDERRRPAEPLLIEDAATQPAS